MADTARKAFVATVVAVAVIALALALWKVKIVLALVFLGFIVAAAIRPGVDRLAEHHIPRPLGVALHYLALVAAIGLLLWLAVPRAVDQVDEAIGGVPTSQQELNQKAKHSTGIKHQFFVGLQKRLGKLPSAGSVVHRTVSIGRKALEAIVGVFFVFATAAYWIFERDRAMSFVGSFLPRRHRRTAQDTWELIDAKLGAYVRGTLLLVVFVATVLSLAFWAIGVPFWLLLGVFAGVVEVVPVIGLTASWQVALYAGITVVVVRQFEDYVVIPRVMGHVTGLSPIVVLVGVSAVGLLFGGFYVLMATPFIALIATLVDVIVRDKDPAEEDIPAVLFAKESRG
jgi:predicted PurR-regulated permease PerM